MKKFLTICAVIAISYCFSLPVGAMPLFLSDWGVTADSLAPINAPSNTAYVKEVYTGNNPNGQIFPGWGGYSFDAKAAYIAFEGTKTYLAIITGLPQEGAGDFWRYSNDSYTSQDWNQELEKYWYVPGSLALDIDGDGSHEFAVTTRVNDDGATYADTPGEGMLVSGNLQFENPRAWSDKTNSTGWGGVSDPWAVVAQDIMLELKDDYRYSYLGDDTGGNATYAIEAIIDTSILGLSIGDTLSMHWTMECGNDAIDISNTLDHAPIPEPGTMMLLGSGIVGLIGLRKKYRI